MRKAFLAIIIISVIIPVQVLAQGEVVSDSDNLDLVSSRCKDSQRYLNNTLRPRDIRVRVNRLQAYRYISKRMEVFTGRLESNSQEGASKMRGHLSTLNNQIDDFKNNYEAYDLLRDQVAKMQGCDSSPKEFMAKINQTRQARNQLNSDVQAIHDTLDKSIISDLKLMHDQYLTYGASGNGDE
ncbi:hypothetical protein KDA08_04080 [Candidatus Saccharibacteria bacterium]|nr:hypothetical protein [Candidatus Saccharibacteria bacterium]